MSTKKMPDSGCPTFFKRSNITYPFLTAQSLAEKATQTQSHKNAAPNFTNMRKTLQIQVSWGLAANREGNFNLTSQIFYWNQDYACIYNDVFNI